MVSYTTCTCPATTCGPASKRCGTRREHLHSAPRTHRKESKPTAARGRPSRMIERLRRADERGGGERFSIFYSMKAARRGGSRAQSSARSRHCGRPKVGACIRSDPSRLTRWSGRWRTVVSSIRGIGRATASGRRSAPSTPPDAPLRPIIWRRPASAQSFWRPVSRRSASGPDAGCGSARLRRPRLLRGPSALRRLKVAKMKVPWATSGRSTADWMRRWLINTRCARSGGTASRGVALAAR